MGSEKSPLVEGDILFDLDVKSFTHARTFVRLEQVSLADAPSKIVLERSINDVSYQARSGAKLHFALFGEMPNERDRYVVTVHVDVDGDGKVSQGDCINMQSYPVLTFGYPRYVRILVKQLT